MFELYSAQAQPIGDIKMKIAFAHLAFLVCSTSAMAAGPQCRAIESNAVRLACYDAAFPPPKPQVNAIEKDDPRAPYKDPFLEEEIRTNARLKGICRGC